MSQLWDIRQLVRTLAEDIVTIGHQKTTSEDILTYLLTYGAEPFLRSCQLCSYS
jgi:hypothetical protein